LRYPLTWLTVGVIAEVGTVNHVTRVRLVWGLLTIAFPALGSELPTKPQVTINVYNDAQVSEQVLTHAEQEATRIFRQAGVDSVWVECQLSNAGPNRDSECKSPAGPTHLALRIVPWSSKLGDTVFGTAFLSAEGDGTYSDVFYESVQDLHKDWHASLSRVLGHVMAHEIGHLLLGTNAHSPMGIMRPNWQGKELRSVGMGALFFTLAQARFMQAKLSPLSAGKRSSN
jgi:hypothetical protein